MWDYAAPGPYVPIRARQSAPGTPAIVESIRAGLVFALKEAVGTEVIQVVALLNDLFGIQARGGCSCAGPYGHRLLAIGAARSHAFRAEIGHGCEGIKPGWTRINFNYFISGTVAGYLIDAVDLTATRGYRLLPDYRFDPHTGLWRHRGGPPRPPLRLRDLHYTPDGTLRTPARRPRVGEESLPGYLDQARELMAARPDHIDDGPTGAARAANSGCRMSVTPPLLAPLNRACSGASERR